MIMSRNKETKSSKDSGVKNSQSEARMEGSKKFQGGAQNGMNRGGK